MGESAANTIPVRGISPPTVDGFELSPAISQKYGFSLVNRSNIMNQSQLSLSQFRITDLSTILTQLSPLLNHDGLLLSQTLTSINGEFMEQSPQPALPENAEVLPETPDSLPVDNHATPELVPEVVNIEPETANNLPAQPKQLFDNVDDAFQSVFERVNNPVRDEYNEDLDFTYAGLPQILNALRPIISVAGMYMTQNPIKNDKGEYEIVTEFCHAKSRTTKAFVMPMMMKKDRRLDACQEFGATITYSRRYHILSIFSISADLDDADQSQAKKERRNAKREAEKLLAQREWKPTTSTRTREESILNVLVACGSVKDPKLIAAAKEKNPHLTTPEEEDLIERVLADSQMHTEVEEVLAAIYSADENDRSNPQWFINPANVKRQTLHYVCKGADDSRRAKLMTETDESDPGHAERLAKRNAIIASRTGDTTPQEDEEFERKIDDLMRAEHSDYVRPTHGIDIDKSVSDYVDEQDLILTEQKIVLCREIASGNGSFEDKKRIIGLIASQADFNARAEIALIVDGMTTTGEPSSSDIKEDDIPY